MGVQLAAVLTVESAQCDGDRRHGAPRLTALEHVANRPIVHHVLDGLREAGVDRVIVAGQADALIDVRASVREHERRFEDVGYALCRDGMDFQATVDVVAPLVGDASCLFHPADGLIDGPLGRRVSRPDDPFDAESADLVLFVPNRVQVGARAIGRALGTLPRELPPDERLAEVALFGPGALARARDSMSGWSDLASAGARMAARGATVHVQEVGGWRRYRGGGHDLLELNRFALDRLVGRVGGPTDGGNRFEGRVEVDPTALVRDSVIIGPTVIGADATVSQSYIGPYTSVGRGARIEGAEIERSIVAAGASVTHVGVRLVSSLVGRDARIFRDFGLPRALRLWLGDGDEVALC